MTQRNFIKKLLLSLSLVAALGTSSDMAAKPETWYGKLAAAPIQFVHHNAYTLNGLVTTPIALYTSGYLYMIYMSLEKFNTDATIPLQVKNMISKTHPAIPAALIAAAWAGITFAGVTLTKSSCKVVMNVFDIPNLEEAA